MNRLLISVAFLLVASLPAPAAQQTFTIVEPFGLGWGPDRVNYPIEFSSGQVIAQGVALKDAAGRPVPVQLSAIELWPDGKSVKKAVVSFIVTLQPDQTGIWKLTAGTQPVPQPAGEAGEVRGQIQGTVIELSNAQTGIRLVGGRESYPEPVAGDKVPAPLQGVRLPNGKWIGKGWWETDIRCTGYQAEITDNGPVFVRAEIRYDFQGGTSYVATVELNAGQDLAIVTEEYNLSAGRRYPMTGVDGMQPEARYAYVLPTFASADKALQTRDPQLARQLAWGLKESGQMLGGHSDASFKMVDPGAEPLTPSLGSAHFPGFGFVMRNGFPRPDEAYLQVYAGAFSWGHGHNDRGTWLLYAKGVPLMVDFAGTTRASTCGRWRTR